MASDPRTSLRMSIFGLVTFSVMAIFMAWILVSYVLGVGRAHVAVKWPTADGIVISSKAVRGCGKGSSYYPEVHYRYSAQGTERAGHRIAFGNSGCGSESAAQVIADHFPLNSAVKVYFDPHDANSSVLLVGEVLDDTWLGIGLMSLFLFASGFIILRLVDQIRSNLPLQGTRRQSARP